MNYIKRYSLFEGLTIHTVNKNLLDKYLSELNTTVSDLDDVFSDLIDMNFKSYLQLFFMDKNGSRYSQIPTFWINASKEDRYKHPLTPYISLSFENESFDISDSLKSLHGGRQVYFQNSDSLTAFSDSLARLKSMYSNYEIYWKFKPYQIEVCIYFDVMKEYDGVDYY